MKKIIFTLLCATLMTFTALTAFADGNIIEKTKTYSNNFSDVPKEEWFAKNVADVYELGLMDGVSSDTFDTESSMTVAQGITIAARLNSLYYSRTISDIGTTDGKWYDKYLIYSIDNGIIDSQRFSNYDRALQSYEMVELFSGALPDEFFPAINSVSEIPDVDSSLSCYSDVAKFYNAGILTGNNDEGWFYPVSALTRKRAAAIISRVALPETRVSFELKDASQNLYTASELLNIVDSIVTRTTNDDIVMMNIGGTDISLAQYRYYHSVLSQNYSGDELVAEIENSIRIPVAVKKVSDENYVTLNYDELRDFLKEYYTTRISYGDKYYALLENYKMSDRFFCEDELLYRVYTKEFSTLFGKDLPNGYTDADVLQYAKENDIIRAKHILIPSDAENAESTAKEALEKVNAGEDFDSLISEYGKDEGMTTHPDGYFFGKGMMVEPFETAAYALGEGETSEIVKSDYGYHIILRLPFDEEKFLASPDFNTFSAKVSTQKANAFFADVSNSMQVTYVDGFEAIYYILD